MINTLLPGRSASNDASPVSARRLTESVFRMRESGILVVLVLFVLVTTVVQSRFLSTSNLQFILINTTVFALLALGETMVVISRNVDLSVGSVLGLSAYVSAHLFSQVHGIPIPVVFAVGIGIGLVCGAVNGAIVAIGRVPSLVVTLATLYIVRGVGILIVGGGEVVAQSLPNGFAAIPRKTLFGVPYLAVAVALVIAAGAYYLRAYRSGRELYAIGSNPDAARLAGIQVGKRIFTAFTVSGAIAGLAGVLWAAQYETIDSSAGTGYELQVVAAVVVGGVAIFGGSGSAVGAALGALLLNTINTALNVLGISPNWDSTISGALLLLAIILDRLISVRVANALRSRSVHRVT
jgi:rhamnose transport system permease protein